MATDAVRHTQKYHSQQQAPLPGSPSSSSTRAWGWPQQGRVKLALPTPLGQAPALGSSLALALLLSQLRESSPEPASRSLTEQETALGEALVHRVERALCLTGISRLKSSSVGFSTRKKEERGFLGQQGSYSCSQACNATLFTH